MIPKKANSLIEKTAKELNMNSELVDIIVTTYWNDVRKELSSLNSSRITIPNFGIFTIRTNKLKAIRFKYQGYLDKKSKIKEAKTFKRYAYVYDAKEYIKRIDAILEFIEQEKDRKFKHIKDRTNGSITKSDLGSPDADS